MKKFVALALALTLALPSVAAELKPMTPRGAFSSLALRDLDGKAHTLADYKGKVVLINFWATWCPPCRAEMPSLERLKQRMAGKPFVILAVDMAESDAQIQAFLKQMNTPKIDFTILKDPNGKALKAWKVFVFPTSFVLDGKGQLRYSLLGSTEWDAPNTVKQIETLLPNKIKQ